MKGPEKLYKTTIVIWSEYHPNESGVEIDRLTEDAMGGESYCSKEETVAVEGKALSKDPDWDGTDFFGAGDDDGDEDEDEDETNGEEVES